MGLEYTEILMACEEQFGVVIDDEQAGRMRTVGDLYHVILTALDRTQSRPCRRPSTFFRLRNAIAAETSKEKRGIRPDTRLADVLPRTSVGRAWRGIERRAGTQLPPLQTVVPEWIIFWSCIILGIPMAGLAMVGYASVFGKLVPEGSERILEWTATLLFVLCVFGLPVLIAISLFGLTRRRVPPAWTVNTLVEADMTGRGYSVTKSEGAAWDSASVWRSLHDLICAKLDARPEHVTPDARFIEDLRAY